MTPDQQKYFDTKFEALDQRLASGDKRFDRFDKRFDELQKYAEALTLHLDRHKTVWKVMAIIGTVVSFVVGLIYQK